MLKNNAMVYVPSRREDFYQDNTGFVEFAAAAAGSIFSAATSIFQTSVQKSIAEKQIKLEREIAARQLDIQKSLTDAQVGLVKVQTVGLQKQQNIDLQIADSNKEVAVLENEIRSERLRAQREIEKVHESIALESAKNPKQQEQISVNQQTIGKQEEKEGSGFLGISTKNWVIGGGLAAIGMAVFLKRNTGAA